jgi:hypothetical protein
LLCPDQTSRFVTESLQTIPGVADTFTVIACKAFSEDKSY